nr:unnamed protein product [Callosobruchus analis]CAI5832194.1 unnamed protein product [Callosobruchus analis]CAI5834703.1 unnamed protein product [Callosobruchus analis]CAI5838431.1 unnamed protein product [Callosobruchus analis]CAI5848077.1 unnamed protein product [Callosobruchus analis]
MKVYKS